MTQTTERSQATYRDAWEAAKACQQRTGKHSTLGVSLTKHSDGTERTGIDCHSGHDYERVGTFADAVLFFNAKCQSAVSIDDLLADLPQILETVTS